MTFTVTVVDVSGRMWPQEVEAARYDVTEHGRNAGTLTFYDADGIVVRAFDVHRWASLSSTRPLDDADDLVTHDA